MIEKRGRPALINPIGKKIREIVKDPNNHLSYEKVAVAADLKYHTLMNLFTRRKVSHSTLKGLKYCGLINEKDEIEYFSWILEHGVKK